MDIAKVIVSNNSGRQVGLMTSDDFHACVFVIYDVKDADSASYSLNVTPDLYPVIAVMEKNDSATQKYYYYVGEISDDYGLRRAPLRRSRRGRGHHLRRGMRCISHRRLREPATERDPRPY